MTDTMTRAPASAAKSHDFASESVASSASSPAFTGRMRHFGHIVWITFIWSSEWP